MQERELRDLIEDVRDGRLPRRSFIQRLVGLGLTWAVSTIAGQPTPWYAYPLPMRLALWGTAFLFAGLAARPDLERLLQTEVATPASDRRFSDAVLQPDLGERPDDQAILQYALAREHTAMEQYRALAESTEPGPFRDLFDYLANEETKHKNELERLYYETVHSGGV